MYPAIRNDTAERLIGHARWHGIVVALRHRYGPSVVIRVGDTETATSREDVPVWVNGRYWTGKLMSLDQWAKDQYRR